MSVYFKIVVYMSAYQYPIASSKPLSQPTCSGTSSAYNNTTHSIKLLQIGCRPI